MLCHNTSQNQAFFKKEPEIKLSSSWKGTMKRATYVGVTLALVCVAAEAVGEGGRHLLKLTKRHNVHGELIVCNHPSSAKEVQVTLSPLQPNCLNCVIVVMPQANCCLNSTGGSLRA